MCDISLNFTSQSKGRGRSRAVPISQALASNESVRRRPGAPISLLLFVGRRAPFLYHSQSSGSLRLGCGGGYMQRSASSLSTATASDVDLDDTTRRYGSSPAQPRAQPSMSTLKPDTSSQQRSKVVMFHRNASELGWNTLSGSSVRTAHPKWHQPSVTRFSFGAYATRRRSEAGLC